MTRRHFLKQVANGTLAVWAGARLSAVCGRGSIARAAPSSRGLSITDIRPHEDLVAYVTRATGKFNDVLFKQVLGAANEFSGIKVSGTKYRQLPVFGS